MRRALALVTIGGLVLVIVAGTWWHFAWARRVAQTQRRNTGRLLADQAVLVRHWETFEELSSSAEESGDAFLDVVRELSDKLNSQEHDSRLIFPAQSPFDPEGIRQAGAEFEKELLDRFAQAQPQQSGDVDWGERLTPEGGYEYYQAVRAQASCLALCHPPVGPFFGRPAVESGAKPLREGDLMAVVAVKMPKGRLR